MGTSNGLDDFSEEAICEYAESYGYIHELDAKGLKEALEGLGYTVLTEMEAKYCIIQYYDLECMFQLSVLSLKRDRHYTSMEWSDGHF